MGYGWRGRPIPGGGRLSVFTCDACAVGFGLTGSVRWFRCWGFDINVSRRVFADKCGARSKVKQLSNLNTLCILCGLVVIGFGFALCGLTHPGGADRLAGGFKGVSKRREDGGFLGAYTEVHRQGGGGLDGVVEAAVVLLEVDGFGHAFG